MVYALLARRLLPGYADYVADRRRDAASYGFFERIGVFGIEPDRPAVPPPSCAPRPTSWQSPDRLLMHHRPGPLRRPARAPARLRPGVARLAEVAPDARFLPLAVEYAFWTERGAEALAAFGPPLRAADLLALPRRERLPGSRRR